ncbi:MarR family winged helix-turn-helix transcriptional regulator [Kitasatospora sp. NPDC051853]|uniref:MarR family winged helix-turn-helix transcriptional regulator n=1 Tax=Kitasatospora sp. NPDC051853 TaxID=3364058 RepID=UPI0037B5C53E
MNRQRNQPPADTDDVSRSIARVARLHRAVAERLLSRHGLHAGQELLMMRLWDHGPQSQSALVEHLGLDASTVTRMVQRLEQSGFVRRRRSESDRRAVTVEATAAARALRDRIAEAWGELEDITLAGLDRSERATLLHLLGRLTDNLDRPAAPAPAPAPAVEQD